MRAIAIGLLGLCGVVLAALIVVFLRMEGPVAKTPAQPVDPRVDVMAGAPDAVILMPFVTGEVPRLVTGARLQELAPQLWYTDDSDAGDLVGSLLFSMMGLPPITDIAVGFQGGLAIKSHACITLDCQNWPQGAAQQWGMAGMRGRGDSLGPEVQLESETFGDHDAYLAAHAAVLADPQQWFADPGAAVPLPGDDGIRLVVISLPTLLVPGVPGKGASEDPAQAQALKEMAATLLEGTGGTVEALYGAASTTLWAMKDGAYLRDGDATRGLPDLVAYQRTLRLMVPEAQVVQVSMRARALALPPPDQRLVNAALVRAFAAWGEDASCLPGCGSVETPLQYGIDVNRGTDPFWRLRVWRVPLALTDGLSSD